MMGELHHAGEFENRNWPLRYFVPSELQCKCCGRIYNSEEAEKARGLLDDLRELMGTPLYIVSGTRCAAHNKAVGGVPRSFHLTGRAFDIGTSRYRDEPAWRSRLVWCAGYLGFGGVGLYSSFVHLDTRPLREMKPTFWTGSTF